MHGWRASQHHQQRQEREQAQEQPQEHDPMHGYQSHNRDLAHDDQDESARPSQFVMVYLPPAPPRQVLLRAHADQHEHDIVQQAADSFARDPQQVRVLGVVPTEALVRGDTILLPLKVRLPNLPDALAYKTTSIAWWGRAQSEAWATCS